MFEASENPWHDEFFSRSAWSPFNALTEVLKIGAPRNQMEASFRLNRLLRSGLAVHFLGTARGWAFFV